MMMQTSTAVFPYEGYNITFETKDGVRFVNMTQMAKPFNKNAKDFLRTQQTQAFIGVLSRKANMPNGEIVQTIQGGSPELQGTWGHKLLALKFAAWLSAEFELWVMECIEKIMAGEAVFSTPLEGEYAELQDLVNRAVAVVGSQNKLALKLHITGGTMSHLVNGKWENLSPSMRSKIKLGCEHILGHGNYIEELERQNAQLRVLLKIKDADLRDEIMEAFNCK